MGGSRSFHSQCEILCDTKTVQLQAFQHENSTVRRIFVYFNGTSTIYIFKIISSMHFDHTNHSSDISFFELKHYFIRIDPSQCMSTFLTFVRFKISVLLNLFRYVLERIQLHWP